MRLDQDAAMTLGPEGMRAWRRSDGLSTVARMPVILLLKEWRHVRRRVLLHEHLVWRPRTWWKVCLALNTTMI